MATDKKLFFQDLTKKSLKQLVQLRNELRKELFEHRLALAIRKLNKTHLIALVRKNIARVNTAIQHKVVG
ncbi:50S ribosomal protein L29 [Patescibacteria group bacterium]|nr:50S ribosomal protein L29 [Patescibacteria group bacterium]